jgi:hypothetical protein
MEQRIFNFNIENKSGIAEIIYGKGMGASLGFAFLMLILIAGFIDMPWKRETIVYRCFALIFVGLSIMLYYKSILKVSFDEDYLYIKIWRYEHRYLIDDINRITLSYYRLWSFAVLSVKTPSKSKRYCLWASNVFERERYELLLSLKDYISDRLAGKVEFTKEPQRR